MDLQIIETDLNNILHLRALFLQECNFQIRYNACHERGWSDSYLIDMDGTNIGYGSVKGKDDLTEREAIFEFYIMPAWRKNTSTIFEKLIAASGTTYIECQSNDLLLSSMLYEFGYNISSDVILFKDGRITTLEIAGATFRERMPDEHLFEHNHEPDGNYVLEVKDDIVATGGFLLHYNKPFADLYMEVREDQRQKGYGSLVIQELKKACFISGRVPAARCNISNKASKATLLKGGLEIAGYMLLGEIKTVTK
ncbi:GNAT family N-acetyltransferase [Mucilaginibacter sp. McL0603]|uniref:GNAT family N-acetyltransferase n=1 Tax=Mucilaginibacter sp. McL0603 TaxID=3415670 RepID=UPI003CE9F1C8